MKRLGVDSQPVSEQESRQYGKRLTQILAMGVIATQSASCVTIEIGAPSPETETAPAIVEQECEPVDDKLLYETIPGLREKSSDWESGSDKEYISDHDLRMEIGSELGLTMYDMGPEIQELHEDIYDPQISVEEYYRRTANFMAQYDIKLSIGTSHDIYDADIDNEHPPVQYSLDDISKENPIQARRTMLGMISTLSDMPVEMVHAMNLKEIRLNNEGAPFFRHSDPGVVRINIQKKSDADTSIYSNSSVYVYTTLLHEATHAWHHHICGPGMERDQQFASVNPDGLDFYVGDAYNDDDLPYESMESALSDPDSRLAARLDPERRAEMSDDIITLHSYGRKNVKEDVATTMVAVLRGVTTTEDYTTPSSAVDYKMDLLIARLYEEDPRLAEFAILTDVADYGFQSENVYTGPKSK